MFGNDEKPKQEVEETFCFGFSLVVFAKKEFVSKVKYVMIKNKA